MVCDERTLLVAAATCTRLHSSRLPSGLEIAAMNNLVLTFGGYLIDQHPDANVIGVLLLHSLIGLYICGQRLTRLKAVLTIAATRP